MSIGIHCEECGKTYQVPDKMAGRRGKCPNGHPIVVPMPAPTVEPVSEENAFAFTSQPAGEPGQRRPAVGKLEPQPATVSAPADDFAFATQVAGIKPTPDEEKAPRPKTGRHKAPDRKAVTTTGKPSLVPLILGGIIGVVGLGIGITTFVMARSEAGPLKDRAEAADKKAAAAEEKARNAESAKLLAEAEVEKLKKTPVRDAGLEKQLQEAKKRATDAERTAKTQRGQEPGGVAGAAMPKELDPDAPGGKNDPVMPGGKLATDPKKGNDKPAAKGGNNDDMPAGDGIPLGGKNWTVPTSIRYGNNQVKAGDLIWLWPQEDTAPKVSDGMMAVRFKWKLRKGKELPKSGLAATVIVQTGNQSRIAATPFTLNGDEGEMQLPYDAKEFQGSLPVTFFFSEPLMKKDQVPKAYSSMIAFQVDFGKGKK
jgi:hypothetical protein